MGTRGVVNIAISVANKLIKSLRVASDFKIEINVVIPANAEGQEIDLNIDDVQNIRAIVLTSSKVLTFTVNDDTKPIYIDNMICSVSNSSGSAASLLMPTNDTTLDSLFITNPNNAEVVLKGFILKAEIKK